MPRQDRPGAIELLGEQHPHHRVRQRQVGQPDAFVRRLAEGRIQPVGAAVERQDCDTAVVFAGEAVDLIDEVLPAEEIVRRLVP